MIEFVLTFAIFVLIVAAMAIGVIRGRKPIAGTCGGLNQLDVGGACEICGGRQEHCEELESLGPEVPEAKPGLATRLMR